MKLGKVIGAVVATRKEGKMEGLKILVVTYLDESLYDTKQSVACIDTVGAGEGDVVLLCSSSSARVTQITKNVATDTTIVGIVDLICLGEKRIYVKSRGDLN